MTSLHAQLILLSVAKNTLKFSPHCSPQVFRQMQNQVPNMDFGMHLEEDNGFAHVELPLIVGLPTSD
jgi:hypothetical protein